MATRRALQTTCNRGHSYQKSSLIPVCPICWPGKYKKGADLPALSAPATRALLGANITTLAKLATWREADVLALHGVGKSSIPRLKAALKRQNRTFKK